MIKPILFLACFLCFCNFYAQKDPPLWPEHFTEAFYFSGDSGKLNTSAKLWYDYSNQLFRTQYDNGVDSQCNYEFNKKTKCVQLYRNQIIYLFMPQQNLCCHYQEQKPPKRDFLRTANFTYKGEATLNNETFDLWQSPQHQQNKYYATKNQDQIPRRFALGSLIRDYIISSYSNNSIDPSIFTIPKYCKKACNGVNNKVKTNKLLTIED